jgi:DNA adenine methylase
MNNQLFESIVVLFANLNIKLGDSELKKFAKSISRKLKRISVIERNNSFVFSEESILDNFETLIKAEYYYFIRNKYNKEKLSNSMRAAYFYFIREYCYSSMFRFNKFGEFNVPYGGLNYNKKDFSKKIEYLKSFEFISNYKKVAFFKSDFEVFLNRFIFSSDDFVFLDPPYDSDFSDYDKSSFSKKDHERLRDWMLNTKAKVMLVIKNTDFIYKLYSNRKFSIHDFSKNYTVSFKNRNEKKAVHLIIKNY